MTAPSTASRASFRQPTQKEVVVLDLISEQGGIPVDQLARFLKIKPDEAKKIAKELQEIGCVELRKLIEGDEPWVWLNSQGARHSNTGFDAIEPPINRLAHTRAINEVRLVIAERAPEAGWVCERAVRPDYPRGAKIPDAVVLLKDERHAIEVEITPKSASRLREIIAEHSVRYDAVVYFCSPRVLNQLERVQKESNRPKLIVRALPGWSSSPPKPKGSTPATRPKRGKPRPDDIPILDLISEQGAIPVDQLARFLECKLDKAKRIVKRLHEAGLLRREKLLTSEPEWVWLSKRGARFSTTDLSAPRPKVGSLALMRATNDVRIRITITKEIPDLRWISRRVLLRKFGRNAAVPKAVVEIRDERHAIEVRPNVGPEKKVAEQIEQRLYDWDAAVYFCAPQALKQVERIKEGRGWPGLIVRELPGND
jgi:DNA-binding MarR family transcriptional regulator